ncbi:MAG: helix-turn-helix transcriptional regulator [Betaproteobacteria bacterium]|nr:helix-turn-helix transcriptional regulator [Betaproteobacteria bacterium]
MATRKLVSPKHAVELTSLFKVLGNETRVRLLHALVRSGELCVSELAKTIGLKPQAVSNQLQRLADRGVVATRREGTTIHYRIVDSCVAELFDRALCLLEDTKSGVHTRRNHAGVGRVRTTSGPAR